MVSDRFFKAFRNSREISCWHDNVFPVWVGLRSDTGTVFEFCMADIRVIRTSGSFWADKSGTSNDWTINTWDF